MCWTNVILPPTSTVSALIARCLLGWAFRTRAPRPWRRSPTPASLWTRGWVELRCCSCVTLNCTRSLPFLLVIERLERARCARLEWARYTAARRMWMEEEENGRGKRKARLCLSLVPVSQLLWTRKERDCAQSNVAQTSPKLRHHAPL